MDYVIDPEGIKIYFRNKIIIPNNQGSPRFGFHLTRVRTIVIIACTICYHLHIWTGNIHVGGRIITGNTIEWYEHENCHMISDSNVSLFYKYDITG